MFAKYGVLFVKKKYFYKIKLRISDPDREWAVTYNQLDYAPKSCITLTITKVQLIKNKKPTSPIPQNLHR